MSIETPGFRTSDTSLEKNTPKPVYSSYAIQTDQQKTELKLTESPEVQRDGVVRSQLRQLCSVESITVTQPYIKAQYFVDFNDPVTQPTPAYVISPGGADCPPLEYAIVLDNSSSTSADISQFIINPNPSPQKGWTIYPQHESLAGKTFKLEFEVQVPGFSVINKEIQISVTIATSLAKPRRILNHQIRNIDCSSSPPYPANINYYVADPSIIQPTPSCTWDPLNPDKGYNFVWTFSPTICSQFLSINASKQIVISTSNVSLASATKYQCLITQTDKESDKDDTAGNINVTIICMARTILNATCISNFTYNFGALTTTQNFPTYTASPACTGFAVGSFTLALQAGGSIPAAFSLDQTNKKFVVTQNINITPGTYNFKMTVTDPVSGLTNSSCIWSVNFVCTTSSISTLSNPIPATTIYILNPNSLVSASFSLPTFQAVYQCSSNLVYSIMDQAKNACATWITCAPTTSITYGTTDWTKAGTYTMVYKATDSVSGVSTSFTFQMIIQIMNATSITNTTAPANQTYLIGTATLSVNLPTYTWYPTQSSTIFTYVLTSAPTFVTIAGSPLKINVQTTNVSNYGSYTITIRTTETKSGLIDSKSFTLLVSCFTSLTPSSSMASVIYFVGDSTISTLIPSYTTTPSGCTKSWIYSVTMADNSALPAQFTFTNTLNSEAINVFTNTQTLTGVYSIKVTVTDPLTGISNSSQTFQITIKCTKSLSLVTSPIASTISYKIDPNSLVQTTLTLPTYNSFPTGCVYGPLTYQLSYSGTFPSWITQNPTTASNIVLGTTDVSKVGTYLFTLTATDPVSGLTNNSVTFTVVVSIKNATSITNATTPVNQTYLIGSAALSVNLPTYTWYPTQSLTSFTYALVGAPSFVTITGSPQKIQVQTSTQSNIGLYTITIQTTETNSGLTDTKSFTLLVTCVTAITPSISMAPITYFVGDSQIGTLIPAYTLTPSGCPNELIYSVTMADNSALPSQFTFTSTSGSQAINVFTTTKTLTGVYNMKVTVTDAKTGITNSAQTFQVTIKCTKSLSLVTNPIASTINYIIDPNSLVQTSLTLPTYDSFPTGCVYGPLTYQLSYSGTFPSWITQNPTTASNIVLGTTDFSKVGTYLFTLTATDPVSGLTNNSVTFTVVVTIKNATSITNATTPVNQTYLIGSATLSVNLPTYTWYPTQSLTSFAYALIGAPSFVTIAGSPLKIQVQTSTQSNTGLYTITIKTTETNSGLTDTKSFTLLVTCVTAITPSISMAPITYFIGDTSIGTLIPAYTLTPSGCPNELTYSVTMSDNSVLPSQFTFTNNVGSETINVFTTTKTLTGVYTMKVTVTDPKTGIQSSSQTFVVTLKCTKSITIVTNPIAATTNYKIDPNVLVQTTLTLPTYNSFPVGCAYGPLSYSLAYSGAFPNWINQNPTTGSNIVLGTMDISKVGTYLFTLTATDPVSGLVNNSVTFTVIVSIKNATSITVATQPANQTYLIGSATLSVNLPTYTWFPTQSLTSFAYTLVGPPTFVTIVGSQIQINTSTYSHTGLYTITVQTTETNSGLTDTKTFTLLVTCVTAITPSSAMGSITYFIGDATIATLIPVFNLTPSGCPNQLTYAVSMADNSALPAQFTFTNTLGSEKINVFTTTQTLTGVYNMKVTVTDPKTGISNSSQTFQVTIKCTKSINVLTNPIAATITYSVNVQTLQQVTLTLPTYDSFPTGCAYGPLTYALTYSGTFPSWINQYPTTSTKIVFGTTDKTQSGSYLFTLIATDPVSGLTNSSVQFTINLGIIVATSITATSQPSNQIYRVGDAVIVVALPIYTFAPADAQIEFTQTLVGAPNFVTISGSNINIQTNVYTDTGTYTIQVKTSETHSTLSDIKTFTLVVSCVQTIAPASALADVIYYISDTAITRTPAFLLTPSGCPNQLTYVVTLANGSALPGSIVFNSTPGSETISVFESNYALTNIYAVKIVVTDPKTGITNNVMTLNVTIKCIKQIDINTNAVANFNYQIDLDTPWELTIPVPTYKPFPTQCTVGTYALEVVFTDTGSFPVWITKNPTNLIHVATQNVSLVGNYNFKIIATESITGLQNQLNAFVGSILTPTYATNLTIITSTAISNRTYLVSDPAVVLNVPEYTITPVNADKNLAYSLGATTPAFITLVPQGTGFPKINIYTTSTSDTGIYSIDVILTENFSGLTRTQTFILTVSCVRTITMLSNISPTVYFITDALIPVSIPVYTISPVTCPYELLIDAVTLADGSALPNAITFDGITTVNVFENTFADTGVYTVKVRAIDPKSLITNQSLTFSVTVKCTKSVSMVTNTIAASNSYVIDTAILQTTTLSLPTYDASPVGCIIGPYTYEVQMITAGTFPTWITKNPTAGISIATLDNALAGNYQFRLVVTDSKTGLQNNSVTFGVDLLVMKATAITAVTVPPNQTYRVGDPMLFVNLPTYSQTPPQSTVVYSYSLITPPGFVLIDGSPLKIQIQTAVYSNTGIYTISILTTETRTGITDTKNFQLLVSCVQSISTGVMTPITYWIGDPLIVTPVPVYTLSPSGCPYELTYSVSFSDGNPLSSQFTFTQTTGSEAINVYETNLSLTGIFTLKVTVSDPKTLVQNNSLLFQVTVKCSKTINLITNPLNASILYTIDKDNLRTVNFVLPSYQPNPAGCAVGTYTYKLVMTSPVAAFPPFINENPTTQISLATSDASKEGIYNFKLVATDPLTGLKNEDVSFQIDLNFAADIAIQTATIIPDQLYRVGDPMISLNVPKYDHVPSKSETDFTYSLIAPTPSFVTLLGTDILGKVQIATSNHANTGVYQVVVQVIEGFSLITKTQSFNLIVTCVQSIAPTNSIPEQIYYIGDPLTSVVVPTYSLIPGACPVELDYQVKLTNGSALPASITLDASTFGSEVIKIYESDTTKAATYSVEIVAVDRKTQVKSSAVLFNVLIRLRASGLTLISSTAISNLTYLVSNPAVVLNVPEYLLMPADADKNFTYQLGASTPALITLVPQGTGFPKINIYTTSTSNTGIYSIDVILTENYSGQSRTQTFVVTVSCVRTITMLSNITPVVYFITDALIPVSIPVYTISPATCPYELVIDAVTLADGSALPNAITFDGITTVNVFENTFADTGVYTVKVRAIDPKSLITNSSFNFSVTVKCTKRIDVLAQNLVASTSFTVDSKNLLSLTLNQPTFQPFPTQCTVGTYSYQLTNSSGAPISVPVFMTAFNNSSLKIETSDISLQATYNYKIQVTESISALINQQVAFELILVNKIYATQMNLITSTIIPDQNYLVGSPKLDLLTPQYQLLPSNSVIDVVYSLTSPPTFVQLVKLGNDYWVEIQTSAYSDTGIYTIVVVTKDNQSGLVRTESFVLVVSCVQDINPAGPLADVVYYISDAAIIRTPLYSLTPSGCPNQLTYVVTLANGSALPGSIVFNSTPGSETISVFESNYALTNIFAVKIVVTDPKTGITDSDLTLNVIIKCIKTIDIKTNAVANFNYQIDLDAPWELTIPVPTYKPFPSQCTVGTYGLEVVFTGTGSFPIWITKNPTNLIHVATQDASQAGNYNFKVVATESITGLKNDLNTFVAQILIPIYTTSFTISPGTEINNLTYLVGSTGVLINAPQYTVMPTNADKNFIYELDPLTPSFVTLVPQASGIPKVSIVTSNSSDTGIYTIKLKITEAFTGLTQVHSFILTVSCVQSIAMPSSVPAVLYYIQDQAQNIVLPLYQLTPSSCPYELQYSATLLDGSPLPNAMTLVNKQLNISENDPAKTGVYTVKITVFDPKSLKTNQTLQVQVTIKCTRSITLLTNSISASMVHMVQVDPTVLYTFPAPTYDVFPTFCLKQTITLEVQYQGTPPTPFPSFVQTQYPVSSVKVQTSDNIPVGAYNFKVIATEPLSGLTNNEVKFKVVVNNSDTAISITVVSSTLVADITYLVGDPAILTLVPKYTWFPTYVNYQFTYELVTPQAYISIIIDPLNGPTLKIETSNPLDTGLHKINVKVTEDFSGLTDITSFNLLITCVRQINPIGSLDPLTYFITDAQITQLVPKFKLVPALCPDELVYTIKMADNSSLPSAITLSTATGSETIKVYETDYLKTGVYNVQVIVTDPKTSVQTAVPVQVTIKCTKYLEMVANPITTLTYNVGTSLLVSTNLPLPTFQPFPAACAYGAYTYQIVNTADPTGPFPSFINQYPSTTITVATQDTSKIASYNFKVIATDPATGLKNEQATFSLVLECQVTSIKINAGTFNSNLNYNLGQGLMATNLPLFTVLPEVCEGTANIDVTLATNGRMLQASPWIWISVDQTKLNLQTSDYSLLGQHKFKLIASVPKFNVVNQDIAFTVNFDCIVQSMSLVTTNWQTMYTYYIDPINNTISLLTTPEYITLPVGCNKPVSVQVVSTQITQLQQSFTKFINADNTLKKIKIQSPDLSLMGSYPLMLIATEPLGGATNKQVQFNVKLDCKVSQINHILLPNTQTEFTYEITTKAIIFDLPRFIMMPVGCTKPLSFQIFNTKIDGLDLKSQTVLPTFIKFDSSTGRITLFGSNLLEGQKLYSFMVQATEPISGVVDLTPFVFTVQTIIQNSAPIFLTALKDVTVNLDDPSSIPTTWELPKIIDKENNKITKIAVSISSANKFLAFDLNTMSFQLDKNLLSTQLKGDYPVTITLVDEYGASASYIFKVKVFDSLQIIASPPPAKSETSSARSIDPGALPAISSQPQTQGQVATTDVTSEDFNGETPPTDVQNPGSILSRDQIPTSSPTRPPQFNSMLTGKISKVDLKGNFRVNWSHKIFEVKKESLTSKYAVEVSVIWMNEAIITLREAKPTYQAKIEEVTQDYISFRLYFDDPDQISLGADLDIVAVNFKNLNFFRRVSDNQTLSPTSQVLVQEIPKQVENSYSMKNIDSAQATGKTATTLTASAMAASGVMGLPSASFFGAFNTVQLISMQTYHGADMPSNAQNFLKSVDQFMKGSALNPQNFMEKMLADKSKQVSAPVLMRQLQSLSAEQQVQELVQTNFKAKNPLAEAGFFLMLMFISLMMAIGLALIGSTVYRCGKIGKWIEVNVIRRLKHVFMFSLLIFAQQFGYVYFVLAGINKKVFEKNMLELGSNKAVVNSIAYYLTFSYVTIYPVNVCLFLLAAGPVGLQNNKIQKYFGSLYSGLDVSTRLNAQTTSIFLGRRFIIGVSIAFFRLYYFLQLEILLLTSMFCMCFIIVVRPYQTTLNNNVEIVNEIMVMITVYIMHGFSYFIPSFDVRYRIGWFYIGIIFTVFTLNLSVIIQRVVLKVILAVKAYRTKRQNQLLPTAVQKLFELNKQKKKKKNKIQATQQAKAKKKQDGLFDISEQDPELESETPRQKGNFDYQHDQGINDGIILESRNHREFRDDNTLPNLGDTLASNRTMEEQMRPSPNTGSFIATPYKESKNLDSLVIEDQENNSNFDTNQKLLDKGPSRIIREVDSNPKLLKKHQSKENWNFVENQLSEGKTEELKSAQWEKEQSPNNYGDVDIKLEQLDDHLKAFEQDLLTPTTRKNLDELERREDNSCSKYTIRADSAAGVLSIHKRPSKTKPESNKKSASSRNLQDFSGIATREAEACNLMNKSSPNLKDEPSLKLRDQDQWGDKEVSSFKKDLSNAAEVEKSHIDSENKSKFARKGTLNKSKLANLSKQMKKLDAGMEDAHQEFKTQNELMSKLSTQIGNKFKSLLQNEMDLFDAPQPITERQNESQTQKETTTNDPFIVSVQSLESKPTPQTPDEIKNKKQLVKQSSDDWGNDEEVALPKNAKSVPVKLSKPKQGQIVDKFIKGSKPSPDKDAQKLKLVKKSSDEWGDLSSRQQNQMYVPALSRAATISAEKVKKGKSSTRVQEKFGKDSKGKPKLVKKTSDEWDDLATPIRNQLFVAGLKQSLTKDQSVERIQLQEHKSSPTVAEIKAQTQFKQNLAKSTDDWDDLADEVVVSKKESAVQQSGPKKQHLEQVVKDQPVSKIVSVSDIHKVKPNMITKGDDGWGDAKPSSFGKPVPTLNMKGLTNFVEKADDGWGDDVALSKKEAPKREVSNADNNEDEEEVKLSILKRKRNSNGLNQSKLADLKKQITMLDSGMEDVQKEMKSHNTLLNKMQTGIGHKFRKHVSDLRNEMGLFDLELQPAHQVVQRGQNFTEDELDLFGISGDKSKRGRGIVENTDFDQDIEFFRMDTFQSQANSPQIKEKPVTRQADQRHEISPIDEQNQQQNEIKPTQDHLNPRVRKSAFALVNDFVSGQEGQKMDSLALSMQHQELKRKQTMDVNKRKEITKNSDPEKKQFKWKNILNQLNDVEEEKI